MLEHAFEPQSTLPPKETKEALTEKAEKEPSDILTLRKRVIRAADKLQYIARILRVYETKEQQQVAQKRSDLNSRLIGAYIHRNSVLYNEALFKTVDADKELQNIIAFEQEIDALEQETLQVDDTIDARQDELRRQHPEGMLASESRLFDTPAFEHDPAFVGISSFASEDHPKLNEDRIAQIGPDAYVVLDGMGGHEGGDIAAAAALKVVHRTIHRELFTKSSPTLEEVEHAIRNAIASADAWIIAYNTSRIETQKQEAAQHGEILSEEAIQKMRIGTTVVLSIIHTAENGTKTLVTGSVGDSMVALYANGRLDCLTLEDGQLLKLADGDRDVARKLQSLLADSENVADFTQRLHQAGLSFDDEMIQTVFSNSSMVNQMLGHGRSEDGRVMPDIITKRLQGNESLLLCTDGVHGTGEKLRTSEMEHILAEHETPQEQSDALCQRARAIQDGDRGKTDDASALLVKLSA